MTKASTLFIIANAPLTRKSIGGGDRFVIETTPFLARKFSLNLITAEVGYHHWLSKPKGVTFIRHPETVFDDKDNKIAIVISYFIRTLKTLLILPRQKVQIIISATHLFPDILPPFICKKLQRKFFWVCRAYQLIPPPKNRPGNFLLNLITFLHQKIMLFCLKSADLVIADNYRTIDLLVKLGLGKNRIKFLPNGVDLESIRKYRQRKKYPLDASFVGRLDPNKGIFRLVAIWKEVVRRKPKAVLGIAGYGPKKTTRELTQAFKTAGLSQNVRFAGFLPHHQGKLRPLFDFILSSKVVLLPESEGGTPLTVLEALACGVPILCSKRPELSRLGLENSLLIPGGDHQRFARKILAILTQPQLRQKYHKSALSFADSFSWKRISEKYIAFLKEIHA